MDAAPVGYTVFRHSDAVVAESLVVVGDDVFWCDITRGVIMRSRRGDPVDGSMDETLALVPPVCSFHPATDGLVVSLGDRVVLVDHRGAITSTVATVDHAHSRMRLNEGKVDPVGRWVTGSMELAGAATRGAPAGAFYSVSATGEVRTIHSGLGVSNGLEWSLDGTRIYFTDTEIETIFTGSYGEDGTISDVEVFREGAAHDGLTIDADGNFWSGIFGEGRVMHMDGDGRELFSVEFPAPNLTSVAFAGSTLYVASAREKMTAEEVRRQPLAGSVFAIETTTTGQPPRTFR